MNGRPSDASFEDGTVAARPVAPAPQSEFLSRGPMAGERDLNFVVDESGQDLAEYALLIALIAIVLIGAVGAFGSGLVNLFNDIVATLPF
jgi:Flp pilus assembly pilin Flp